MTAEFTCNGEKIENVSSFKYLGLVINRCNNNPGSMLENRIIKAK